MNIRKKLLFAISRYITIIYNYKMVKDICSSTILSYMYNKDWTL